MSWGFIDKALSTHGFPPKFKRWILECVTLAHFTILFQGQGDGFIVPMRGIRQGYALSSYIFILYMNICSMILLHELHQGNLSGLKLIRATPLTNLISADNLIILGKTSSNEIRRVNWVLNTFCSILEVQTKKVKNLVFQKHFLGSDAACPSDF